MFSFSSRFATGTGAAGGGAAGMLSFPAAIKVYLCTVACDMRRSFARIHEEHGALPTLTIRSAAEIDQPAAAIRRALESAQR